MENKGWKMPDEERLEIVLDLVGGVLHTLGYGTNEGMLFVMSTLLSGSILSQKDANWDDLFDQSVELMRRHFEASKESLYGQG